MEYKVKYYIEIEAESAEEAALQVEKIMRDGQYRPHLSVIDTNNETVEIDLELGTEKKIDTSTNKVIMTVSGGVADVQEKPAGVEVEIRDYDIEGSGFDLEGNPHCKEDKDGDCYYEMLWQVDE